MAALFVVLLQAVPSEAKVLRGTTGQGRKATVKLFSKGRARLTVDWNARCSDKRDWRDSTAVISRTGRWNVRDRYAVRQGAYVGSYRVRIHGRRVSKYMYKGTFGVRLIIRRRGRLVARCSMKTTRWRATSGRFDIRLISSAGDHIGGGGNYHFKSPRDSARFQGSRKGLLGRFGGFTLQVTPGDGHKLRKGRYTPAFRAGFSGTRPGINLSRAGNSCTGVVGEFTINSIAFDSKGRLRSLNLVFTQHCEFGSAPPLTGFVYWRR
jgi:hypothetical protein